MTDNEIIKALKGCGCTPSCKWCPYYGIEKCYIRRNKDFDDLINRQKAEIERLNKEVDRLSQCVLYHDGQITDAIKEFAERLQENISDDWSMFSDDGYTLKVDYDKLIVIIDNLVKEMVGDAE